MGLVGAAFGLGFIFGPAIGGVLSRFGPSRRRCGSRRRCASPTSSRRGSCCPSRARRTGATKTLGRMEAFRRAMAQADAAAAAGALLHRHAGVLGLRGDVRAVQRARGSASRRRRSGTCSRSSASCWRWSRACWSAGSCKRVGERAADPDGDLRHRASASAWCRSRGTCRRCWSRSALLAVGMGFNSPSLSSMVSRLTDPDDQGGMLGLASSLASLGRVVGPAWGGFLFDARHDHAVPERRGHDVHRRRRGRGLARSACSRDRQ